LDQINYNALREAWDFSIEDVKCFWKPEFPFLTSDESEYGPLILKNITDFLEHQWEDEIGMFRIPPTGPSLCKSVASPYAVLWAILAIYGDEPELVSFSDNAPKWEDIDPTPEGVDPSEVVN